MRTAQNFRLVFVTAGTTRNALRISRALVSSKSAACVNIVPGIRSIYRWKRKVRDDRELLLIVKTSVRKLNEVEKTVRKLHAYEVPEILSVRLDRGSEPYLRWLAGETTKKRGD